MKTESKNRLFLFILLPLCLIASAVSFNRFVIKGDYIVEYEGTCNPATEECFAKTDDTTGKVNYYTKVQKYAPDLYAECGESIIGCTYANVCVSTDKNCSITHCSADALLDNESCVSTNPVGENQP